ncbi:MFS transporter [Desulfofundulus thermocisternus]|uniref:MFS transporter n=1 Tax=Desulfofundulus thermocisternus TaxID=42471 RepID=UPI00217DE61A|nr:MFS transporter [Desulfofundulus thermocisternus]MCS5695341.1 MFS transporter [Desulfofundulus thermocisternus]
MGTYPEPETNIAIQRTPHILFISLVNFLLNFAVQGSLIFIPLLGAQLGARDWQIGLVGASYGAAFLFSSLICGWKSDSLGRLLFVRLGLAASGLAFAAQLLVQNLFVLIVVRSAVGLSLGIATAALIAYAFESGADMGKFSSYGSLGWICGALGAALLKEFNLLFITSFACSAAAFIFSLTFRESGTVHKRVRPGLWQVMRRNFQIYLAVFLRHLGATAVWIILPLYFSSLGMNRFWIGLLWGINFAVQFVVMRFLERFDENKVFAFGQLLSIGVFTAYAFITARPALLAVQALLGVAWSCLYVGALLIVLRSGEERGTASGIFQSTLNLCNAVGPFLGGLIAELWGYRGVMLFAAGLGVAGLLVAVPAAREAAGHSAR